MRIKSDSPVNTTFKVGLFTVLGMALLGAITVYVNDRPFWWRPCQFVEINIEDATGLKSKSPVRSLGLQIGFLKSVRLHQSHVRLGICITAPVEVLPATRAYIRGEGFLGDKFVELKPVKYTGGEPSSFIPHPVHWASLLMPSAYAAPPKKGREIPVGESSQDITQLAERIDGLVSEMTKLTDNLKEAINPTEFRKTIQQLNETLSNASKTFSPQGGLTSTAQRTLAKLEDAIEQLRDMLTRVNQGEGSVGSLINDKKYADEIYEAVQNVNRLLSKVGGMVVRVDMGAQQILGWDGGRGWFKVELWPDRTRYYQVGLGIDPRGAPTVVETTTVANGVTTTTTTTQLVYGGFFFTAKLGKVFWDRLDFSAGLVNSDGAVSAAVWLGPSGDESRITLQNEVYYRSTGATGSFDNRAILTIFPLRIQPFSSIYVHGGLEGVKKVNGSLPFFFGAGINFDDRDIKLLFSFL